MPKSLNYEVIVSAIMETCSDKLNDWESGFIDGIFDLGAYTALTDLQKEKIREIHTKYCKSK
jgi:hypothetical protein